MPPSSPTRSGALRRIWLPACLVVVAAVTYGFLHLGSFLVLEDPLQKADAILALAGTRMSRQLYAAELYLEGYGRHIVLSREVSDAGERALAKRGIPFPEATSRATLVFLQLGIPRNAILVPERIHNSTFAFRRELTGTGVEVVMRGTRYGDVDPEHWWRHRGDIRMVGSEVTKLIAYVLGLGA